MRAEIELLKAEIRGEMTKIGRVIGEFTVLKEKLDAQKDVTSYDKAAIGYFLHNFYNGSENIFRS